MAEAKVRRVHHAMGSVEAVSTPAETFRALGDPTRLRIAFALWREELSVCDIATTVNVSQSVVSPSLRALRQMRLVRFRKVGKIAYYTLDDEQGTELSRWPAAHVGVAGARGGRTRFPKRWAITFPGLLAIGWSLTGRARSALVHGLFLGGLGASVLVATAYRVLNRLSPISWECSGSSPSW